MAGSMVCRLAEMMEKSWTDCLALRKVDMTASTRVGCLDDLMVVLMVSWMAERNAEQMGVLRVEMMADSSDDLWAD